MKNADKIRSMTDEELEEFLENIMGNCWNCGHSTLFAECDHICSNRKEWLQEETNDI